jgi:hypothetical protein
MPLASPHPLNSYPSSATALTVMSAFGGRMTDPVYSWKSPPLMLYSAWPFPSTTLMYSIVPPALPPVLDTEMVWPETTPVKV